MGHKGEMLLLLLGLPWYLPLLPLLLLEEGVGVVVVVEVWKTTSGTLRSPTMTQRAQWGLWGGRRVRRL